MAFNLSLKYKTNTFHVKSTFKVLHSTIKVVGSLGILVFTYKYLNLQNNKTVATFYYIKPIFTNYLYNSFIISNFSINSFFMDMSKLLFGVNYG